MESYLHQKALNSSSDVRFCSPTKIGHSHFNNVVSTKVKINMMEKVSQRMEQLKKDDYMLDIDVLDYFWKALKQT